jgi:hypothetical protein
VWVGVQDTQDEPVGAVRVGFDAGGAGSGAEAGLDGGQLGAGVVDGLAPAQPDAGAPTP